MHGRPSLLQAFFTRQSLDGEALNGRHHLPGRAGIMACLPPIRLAAQRWTASMPESPSAVRSVRFGVFEVDLRAGEIRKKGIKIRLQGQPFLLLITLLKQQGEVVTREELRRTLWPEDTFVDFDHGLGTAINKLREVLGDSAANPRFVETVHRRGYRFIAPVVIGDGVEATPIVGEVIPATLEPATREVGEAVDAEDVDRVDGSRTAARGVRRRWPLYWKIIGFVSIS